MQVSWRPAEVRGPLGARGTGTVSRLVEVLGTELGPQQEQVLIVAEPSLQFPK